MTNIDKFEKYIFIKDENPIFGGDMIRYKFPNGYGASVVIDPSYIFGKELAVLEFSNSEYGEAIFDTEIADDVIRFIDDEELDEILERIAKLGKDGKTKKEK